MIKSLVAMLISGVYSRECGRGSFYNHEDDDSCISSCSRDCDEARECRRYLEPVNRIYCDDKRRRQSVIMPRPMVCHEVHPRTNTCCPYLQFTHVVQFCVSIPSSKRIHPLFLRCDIKALECLASKADCFQNYDALNAFYFNADCHSGVITRQFSSDFILFFLTRFFYYLQLAHIDSVAFVNGNELVYINNKKCIDLLCIPNHFNNTTFGTEANALRIFNIIISDTTITRVVSDFISVLLKQICVANSNNIQRCGSVESFNTFFVYITVLQAYLTKTKEITLFNLQQKIDFLTPQLQFSFILFPYLTSTGAAPTKAFEVIPINVANNMILSNTARFV